MPYPNYDAKAEQRAVDALMAAPLDARMVAICKVMAVHATEKGGETALFATKLSHDYIVAVVGLNDDGRQLEEFHAAMMRQHLEGDGASVLMAENEGINVAHLAKPGGGGGGDRTR